MFKDFLTSSLRCSDYTCHEASVFALEGFRLLETSNSSREWKRNIHWPNRNLGRSGDVSK